MIKNRILYALSIFISSQLTRYSQFKTLCLDVIAHENPETMVDNEKTITLTPNRFTF